MHPNTLNDLLRIKYQDDPNQAFNKHREAIRELFLKNPESFQKLLFRHPREVVRDNPDLVTTVQLK